MLVNTKLEKLLMEATEREWDECMLPSTRRSVLAAGVPVHVCGGGQGVRGGEEGEESVAR